VIASTNKLITAIPTLPTSFVSGLAVAPMNADSVTGVIAEARKKGIPVITFDSDAKPKIFALVPK
jgi:ABC-type sugar transport system substrate-binding protein